MPIVVVPEALREKLGDKGSEALVELLKSVQEETKEDAITLVEERFARRLAEEIGKLRAEIYGELNKIWEEMGNLRAEMHSLKADMIKWMFVFWIGQLLTLIGIVIALVKFVG